MRTPEQIEAEIDRIRSNMDFTLNELEQRLNPRELWRDGIQSLSGLEATRYVLKLAKSPYLVKAADLARRYPKPAAFGCAGLAGIYLAGRYYRNRNRNALPDEDTVTARLSKAMDAAREKLVETRQSLGQSAETAGAKLSGVTSNAMERASDIASSAGKQLRKAGSSVQGVARERPVAVGATALLALTAAIAMSMPSVRRRFF